MAVNGLNQSMFCSNDCNLHRLSKEQKMSESVEREEEGNDTAESPTVKSEPEPPPPHTQYVNPSIQYKQHSDLLSNMCKLF